MKHSLLLIFLLTLLSSNSFAAQNSVYAHSNQEAQAKCSSCHEMSEGKKFFHKPVQADSCASCHNVFAESKNLLRTDDILDICIMCHSDKRRTVESDEYAHPPVKQDCTNCHDPHAGEHQFRLKADRKRDICLTCHSEKKAWIDSVKNKHGAINLDTGGCIACHDPHGTGQPKMLKAEGTKDLCLKCHNKSLKRDEDGKMLLNIGEHLENNKKWHGPIIAGECTGCHNPHGSNNHRMLKRPFPTKTRTAFKEDGYVCFKCHDLEKVTQKSTTTFTNFRKGSKNLHTIHVKNSSIVCNTCHDLHGVDREIPLVKRDTTFVGTKFNLRYIKTPDGGSCNPICHAKREYKRGSTQPR